jgi:malate synthase
MGEEYQKLLNASSKDVFEESKVTTLPIAMDLIEQYMNCDKKIPWLIDLLNINLNVSNLEEAKRRTRLYIDSFVQKGERITGNLDN